MSGLISNLTSKVASTLGYSTQPDDTVSIIVNNQQISGWQSVIIRRSIEVMPSTFELETTEWAPGQVGTLTILEGSPCTISIGADLVITGYVTSVTRSVEAGEHTVRVVGASRSTDIVDCSARFQSYQINNTTALALANTVTAPFGITASVAGDVSAITIPQFDVILSETPYEIIERVTRYAQCLCYDDPQGNLVLSQSGTVQCASGFTEGVNVEKYSCTFSMAERYSQITAVLQPNAALYLTPSQPGSPGNSLQEQLQFDTAGTPATDPNVKRYRTLIIPMEQGDFGLAVTQKRVQWEVNRRIGRAYQVEVTCDRWRDDNGTLWAINTLAPIFLPAAKCTPSQLYVIASIAFRRDMSGTHADIVLMMAQAFQPAPIVLQPTTEAVAAYSREQQNLGTPSPSTAGPAGQ